MNLSILVFILLIFIVFPICLLLINGFRGLLKGKMTTLSRYGPRIVTGKEAKTIGVIYILIGIVILIPITVLLLTLF